MPTADQGVALRAQVRHARIGAAVGSGGRAGARPAVPQPAQAKGQQQVGGQAVPAPQRAVAVVARLQAFCRRLAHGVGLGGSQAAVGSGLQHPPSVARAGAGDAPIWAQAPSRAVRASADIRRGMESILQGLNMW